jgi:hypothetical protein
LWAADCALLDSPATFYQEEIWDQVSQVWTIFNAAVTIPEEPEEEEEEEEPSQGNDDFEVGESDDDTDNSSELTGGDGTEEDDTPYPPSEYELSDLVPPVSWKENKKWNDGKFCNVEDPFKDAHMITDPDDDSDDVEDRPECWKFCADNRKHRGSNCCGIIFENNMDSDGKWGRTKIHCGLYKGDLVER